MGRRKALREAKFYQSLSLKSQVKLYSAVFFTFAPLAFLAGSRVVQTWPAYQVIAWMIGSGIIAVCYAFSFTRSYKFLSVTIPLHIVIPIALAKFFVPAGAPGMGLSLAGVGSVFLIALGYVFYIIFITTEGTRTLRLQTEINLAQQIHSHLVPEVSLTTRQLEIYGKSVASNEVGGDLVDVVDHDGKLGLYIADVSGHGVRAGVLMSMVKSAIRMKLLHSTALDKLCSDLNSVVFQVKQAEMFVTFSAMSFDGGASVQYAMAGHPPILHYERESRTVRQLPNQYPPLGVLEGLPFATDTAPVEKGDIYVLLTDGLLEIDGEWDVELGLKRIEKIVAENADKPMRELYTIIVSTVASLGKIDDDQTLLLARVI